MKKVISLLLAFCIMLSALSVAAETVGDIKIILNGETVETNSTPYIKNDPTMVPMRAIFEALGAEVIWNDTDKRAYGIKDGTAVEIAAGENKLYKDGEEVTLDCAAEIINGRMMIPVRAVSEALGANVFWDNGSRAVQIILNDDIKVIRIGTHARYEDDPYYKDPVTGEKYMDEVRAEAKIYALKKVKESLGVEIEFVQYTTSDYRTLIEESVKEGEPFCDLAILWGGSQKSALEKDLIQPIDEYKYIFSEGEFPIEPKAGGHYYFMSRDFNFINTWPILYNISMLDSIPELKEADGTTLYPAELYYRGEWTWSGFEDYMSIVSEHCKKQASGIFSYGAPVPFETNYLYFAESALHSVGASVYDGEEVNADTEEALRVVEFVRELFEKGLVSCESAQKFGKDTGWTNATSAFLSRKTYFTNCAPWKITQENFDNKIGIVPFPYPDGTNPHSDGSAYSHSNHGGDSVALVKGIDDKTSRIALLAYKTYLLEYHKALAGADSMEDFVDKYASVEAESRGIDTTHPEIGELHAKIWAEYGKTPVNECSEAFDLLWKWSNIFGEYAFLDGDIDKYKEETEKLSVK